MWPTLAEMDPEVAQDPSSWQGAMQLQAPVVSLGFSPVQVTDQSVSPVDESSSSGSSGMYSSWNYGFLHALQSPELPSNPFVSVEAPMQNLDDVRPPFNRPATEQGVNYYYPQATYTLPQMMASQGLFPSQPQPVIFNGSLMMPSREFMVFSNEQPVCNPSAIPVPYIRAPTMAYSESPMAPSHVPAMTHGTSLAPAMPFAEAQAMPPSLRQVLPPREPYSVGMPPSECSSLLDLSSQGALRSHPDSQETPQQTMPTQRSRKQEKKLKGCKKPRSYVCSYKGCRKSYTRNSHLVNHHRTHTGERPYICKWPKCCWSFTRSDELERHTRIHTQDRPHKCSHCNRDFMRSDHLKQHQKTHMKLLPKPQGANN